MSRKLLITFVLLQLLACGESPYNNSPSAILAQKGSRTAPALAKETQQFKAFIDTLSSMAIIEADHAMQQHAKTYFPDSTIHRDQLLYGRNFSLSDSSQVIYYEYSLEDPSESNAYLGLFSKAGEALDLLKIKEVSYDGSITINLIDNQVMEVEYYDFFSSDQLFKSEIYTDRSQRIDGRPYWKKTAIKDHPDEVIDYYYYENYSIESNGNFKLLEQKDSVNLKRKFPFLSLRVLTNDELIKYKATQLREMINEIYASYGFIFRNPQFQKYYKRKSWYTPLHENVDQFISDIERINIKKLAKLETAKEQE